jgi:putative ABC transport system permease protein
MKLEDYLGIASHQLKKNRMRTALTVLGIVIGVASMITVISVGEGGKEMIGGELSQFGVNRIWLFPHDLRGPSDMLVLSDVEMLQQVNGVDDVAPSAYEKTTLSDGAVTLTSDVVGTTQALFNIERMAYSEGRGLTEQDVEYSRRVVVLSEEAKDTLFGDESAEGKKVSINGQSFKCRGRRRRSVDLRILLFRQVLYPDQYIFGDVFNKICGRDIGYCGEYRGAG